MVSAAGAYTGRTAYRMVGVVVVANQNQNGTTFSWSTYGEGPGGSFVLNTYRWSMTIDGTMIGEGYVNADYRNVSRINFGSGTTGRFPHRAAKTFKFVASHRNVDIFGTAALSGNITAPRIPYPAPSTPATPTVASAAAGEFTTSWTKPAGTVTGYDLRFASTQEMSGAVLVTSVTTPHRVTGQPPGNDRWVQVRAKNADATSGWSTAAKVMMKAAAPAAPAVPSLTTPDPGKVRATWNAPTATGGKPITGYDLRWALRADMTGAQTILEVTTPHTLTVSPGATVWVQVRAKNADATSGWSTAAQTQALAGGWAAAAGAWLPATPYDSLSGVWALTVPHYSNGATWRVTA